MSRRWRRQLEDVRPEEERQRIENLIAEARRGDVLARAGFQVDPEIREKLDKAMRSMNAAGLPVSDDDVVRVLRWAVRGG